MYVLLFGAPPLQKFSTDFCIDIIHSPGQVDNCDPTSPQQKLIICQSNFFLNDTVLDRHWWVQKNGTLCAFEDGDGVINPHIQSALVSVP